MRHGGLTVVAGAEISIATREAVLGDSYATLDAEVLHRFRADIETERTEHVEGARLQMIETMAIYCLVIALLLLFANPLLK